ncbi:MAG: EamA family transporter RarD [Opitutales bacterium]
MGVEIAPMGLLFAVAAYLIWGLVPLYWKELRGVPALELICHRVVWSALLAAALIRFRGRGREFLATWRRPRSIALHAVAAVLIAANWLAFVWAVLHERVLDASLGYFMCPLVSVLLATLVLGERLRTLQWVAVAVAGLGVAYLIGDHGTVPIPALVVAFTWSGYGFVKKRTALGSIAGLGMELLLLLPLALGWLAWQARAGALGWDLTMRDWTGNLWLFSTGLVTIVPLLLVAEAAKSISLTTLGLFQYFVPSAIFALAVFYFREPFSTGQLVTFGAIWAGLGVYGLDRWQSRRPVPKRPDRSRPDAAGSPSPAQALLPPRKRSRGTRG